MEVHFITSYDTFTGQPLSVFVLYGVTVFLSGLCAAYLCPLMSLSAFVSLGTWQLLLASGPPALSIPAH